MEPVFPCFFLLFLGLVLGHFEAFLRGVTLGVNLVANFGVNFGVNLGDSESSLVNTCQSQRVDLVNTCQPQRVDLGNRSLTRAKRLRRTYSVQHGHSISAFSICSVILLLNSQTGILELESLNWSSYSSGLNQGGVRLTLNTTDAGLETMEFSLKTAIFYLNMMDFVLKMANLY